MLHELKSIKYTVKSILRTNPETRDDDNKLIQAVWAKQFPGLLDMSAGRLLFHLRKKHLCSTKSIIRKRQHIQQQGEFIGKYYIQRHQEEVIVRTYFKTKINIKCKQLK